MTDRNSKRMDATGQTPEAGFAKERSREDLLSLALTAPLAGLGAGLVGALFRRILEDANELRDMLVVRMHGWSVGGLLLLAALAAAATALAAWLVRRIAPSAAGSGIPRVEAVLNDEVPPAPARVVPVKFLAGTLAIGSGLALGREGPSVQMGASIAYQTGRALRCSSTDCRALLAAGAGAGFATAFNAPIAGAVFVLERLVRRFETRIAIAALAASAVAIWVGRSITGHAADYAVGPLIEPGFAEVPLFVLLGAGAGLLGMFYDRALLGGLNAAKRLSALPVELRAASVGAAVALLAWFAPTLVGGGDGLAQQALNGTGTLTGLPLVFLLRLALVVCSVAAGTPGGLLVPFLALGAEYGLWLGKICALSLPAMAIQPQSFAVVGMAALFASIVRAPITAIVLVTEMTADVTMLLSMIVACFAAMVVPTLFGEAPILDSLRERLLLQGSTVPPLRD